MARLSPLLSSLVTYLIIISFLSLPHGVLASEISLTKEPEENYYLVKNSPVAIVCQAKNAAEIIFTCRGTQIPQTSVETDDDLDLAPHTIQAKIEVTKADVQNHHGDAPFWCTCGAADISGQIVVTSRKGYVSVAYLKNKFETQPRSMTVKAGENVELECRPPKGHPKPEIRWIKEKKRVEFETDLRLTLTDLGNLVIRSATTGDSGKYQCVAWNVAGRRGSDTVQLTVMALEESAEPSVVLSEDNEVSNKTGAGKPRTTRQSIKTYFTTEPQEKYYVAPNKPLLIDCNIVAADIVTFRCNGRRMEREKHTIKQGLDASGNRKIESQLTITYDEVQAFQKDFGDGQAFQCICAAWFQDTDSPNGWGRLESSTSHGFIYLAYLDSTFQTEPSDVTVGVNAEATLGCEPPKGEPGPWVHWNKDGNRLDPRSSDKYTITPQGYLIIHNVQTGDAGSYACLAENTANSVQSRAARLTVTDDALAATTVAPSREGDDYVPTFPAVIPVNPVFVRDLETENVLGRDGTKTLICAVVSATQMTVECEGKRLPAEQFELKSTSQQNAVIWYAKTVITQEKVAQNPDNYFCQCTAWHLNELKHWERVTSNKGYVRIASQQGSYIEEEFVSAPVDTSAYYEDEAQLICQPPEGSPPPTVYWLKDGVRIDPLIDSNFVILDRGTLFIEYVRVTDEGRYTCVAENEAGRRVSGGIQFTVLGKPTEPLESTTTPEPEPVRTTPETMRTTTLDLDTTELTEPFFTQEPSQENFIVRGQPVTLTCAAIATEKLIFVCNGETMRNVTQSTTDTFFESMRGSIHEISLTVTKEMVEAHSGSESLICVCRAYGRQVAAEYVESSLAVIQVAYLENQFHREPSDTKVPYLGKAELPCKAPKGVPEPKVHWLKDGFRISENERIYVESSGTLIINGFSEADEDSYTCVAQNGIESRTSHTVAVTLTSVIGEVEPVTEPDAGVPEPETTAPGRDEQILYTGSPYISKDLHAFYYLVKNKRLSITCQAYGVDFITFTCGNKDVEDQETLDKMEEQILPNGQVGLVKVVEALIDVPKEELEDHEPGEQYWCQCFAHYHAPGSEGYQTLNSSRGVVELAYLKKNFQEEPESQTVTEGHSFTIICEPPAGNPEPTVSWLKDGEDYETLLNIGSPGMLFFPEAKPEHTGEYICVAENEAGKRTSSPILIEVKEKDDSPTDQEEAEENIDEEDAGPNVDEESHRDPDLNVNRETGVKKGIEHIKCVQMLTDCQTSLPHSADPLDICAAFPEYSDCMDNYISICTNVISRDSMSAVKLSYMQIQGSCEQNPKCEELVQCERIASQIPKSGLEVQILCREHKTLKLCVDHAVVECSSKLSSQDDKVISELLKIDKWFSEFCGEVIRGSKSLETCDRMAVCDASIKELSTDNTTSFCTLISTLIECTNDAVHSCHVDELRNNLEYLHSEAVQIGCIEDVRKGEDGESEPGAKSDPEPEVTVERENEGMTEPDDDETNEKEADITKDSGGRVGGSQEAASSRNNGSTTFSRSVMLVFTLQILIVVNVSLR